MKFLLLLLFTTQVQAADFIIQISPAPNSVSNNSVADGALSSSKISDFLNAVQNIFNNNQIGVHATLTSSTVSQSGGRDLIFDSDSSSIRREYDTNGIYNTSNGVITIPENGRYLIYAQARLVGTKNHGATKELFLTDLSNNVIKQMDEVPWVSSVTPLYLKGQVEIIALSGEQFKIRLGSSSDSLSITGDSLGVYSYLTIRKLGN